MDNHMQVQVNHLAKFFSFNITIILILLKSSIASYLPTSYYVATNQ